jgi:hypothetical protein
VLLIRNKTKLSSSNASLRTKLNLVGQEEAASSLAADVSTKAVVAASGNSHSLNTMFVLLPLTARMRYSLLWCKGHSVEFILSILTMSRNFSRRRGQKGGVP